jgi:glycine/D-amino acid oxidase-like deaminating enzyme
VSQRELRPRTIAIVGAGFSGTMVAINLLRAAHERPVRVVLLDRDKIARGGVAYARRPYPRLLNLPAVRMSASSADPMEFSSEIYLHLADGRRRCWPTVSSIAPGPTMTRATPGIASRWSTVRFRHGQLNHDVLGRVVTVV